jgi:ribose transport system permease protein
MPSPANTRERFQRSGLIVLLLLLGAMTLRSDEFLTGDNMANLARQVAILGGIAVGVAIGLFNGALVAYAKLPPFIVTLGMLGIARGVVLVLTDASTVQPLPDSFGNIANGNLLGLPNLLWLFAAAVAIASFVLLRTVFGRYVYALGSDFESARLSGVPVTKVLIGVYAIAACVIGGASLFGAEGGAFGAAAGALIVATLDNGGNLLAINAFYLQIIIGALILIAVFFDQWQGRRAAASGR